MSSTPIRELMAGLLLAVLLPMSPALQATTPGSQCVDDELPGRFTGAPLRLCVLGDGEQRRFVLSIAEVERLQAGLGAVRTGALADWAGHALGLQCSDDGMSCEISVDGRDAWKGRLPEPTGTDTAD
ncbi:MAG TPA: hypothetical protein VF513_11060 [Stenotrophomonas sp.]|jgi:hypothetical protein|uniref:hypothetical protein n=1 Tax=Stenotrophomonas pigmentata TaxID=3055080 RepID=UPI0026E91DF1|nr:hypothetical protein [Stenotrophomonas sp. 610A2]